MSEFFNVALREARMRAGLTQFAAAQYVRVDTSTYQRYETNRALPTFLKMAISLAVDLAGATGSTPRYFIESWRYSNDWGGYGLPTTCENGHERVPDLTNNHWKRPYPPDYDWTPVYTCCVCHPEVGASTFTGREPGWRWWERDGGPTYFRCIICDRMLPYVDVKPPDASDLCSFCAADPKYALRVWPRRPRGSGRGIKRYHDLILPGRGLAG